MTLTQQERIYVQKYLRKFHAYGEDAVRLACDAIEAFDEGAPNRRLWGKVKALDVMLAWRLGPFLKEPSRRDALREHVQKRIQAKEARLARRSQLARSA